MTEFLRDAAATAAIFGFFGSAWFGWAQEKPPPAWRRWLITGSVLSILSFIAGGLLTWRHWSDGTVFDETVGRTFGIIVGIEFALAGLGAAVLGLTGRRDYVPVWIALVVGVHLFPVAVVLHYPFIHVIAALATVAALAAIPIARARSLPVSAVNGLGIGSALLLGALVSLGYALFGF
ncbi:hypothetical protein F4553_002198 [Allocatelliglobosispora scoriae]|uniref:Uncharacterized protein n=1 Tax=Allocatelliglobosispora scoriae TaxID=643052 RepID=A0A841BNP2_9ACTN|nr:hypothetical protein [Allocatelliglobosispora scoriae]MBB5868819.1 hypothetical protein [Allocatelliglobosispora scoriae]